MALSQSHKFGQIIGDTLEVAVYPLLKRFADKHGLYLDRKERRAAREGKNVVWTDSYGNKHALDFVLERGGTQKHIGSPVAFVETAWRRYTKHSRNKAQEIQGALLPLLEAYKHNGPCVAAVIAGEFTLGARDQMSSLGFSLLYFPYKHVVAAFASVGIDAYYTEDTPEAEFSDRIAQWEALPPEQKKKVGEKLLAKQRAGVKLFLDCLERVVIRRLQHVRVIALHGNDYIYSEVREAIAFIEDYADKSGLPFVRFEVEIAYTNSDVIRASFSDKSGAIGFLGKFLPRRLKPVTPKKRD